MQGLGVGDDNHPHPQSAGDPQPLNHHPAGVCPRGHTRLVQGVRAGLLFAHANDQPTTTADESCPTCCRVPKGWWARAPRTDDGGHEGQPGDAVRGRGTRGLRALHHTEVKQTHISNARPRRETWCGKGGPNRAAWEQQAQPNNPSGGAMGAAPKRLQVGPHGGPGGASPTHPHPRPIHPPTLSSIKGRRVMGRAQGAQPSNTVQHPLTADTHPAVPAASSAGSPSPGNTSVSCRRRPSMAGPLHSAQRGRKNKHTVACKGMMQQHQLRAMASTDRQSEGVQANFVFPASRPLSLSEGTSRRRFRCAKPAPVSPANTPP